MTHPLIVFVHGGQHTKHCWSPTIEAIAKQNPTIATLAVNLPGHGDEPGDLASLTIAQCVESVCEKILAHNPSEVVLIGHSMAGITIPGVATQLGQERMRRLIFLGACVPPQGKAVIDTLHFPMNWVARYSAKKNPIASPLPGWFACWVFANGANKQQKQLTVDSLCSESTTVTLEPVDRSQLPEIATTWILPLRDRAMRPASQRQFIKNLGRVDEILEIDTCHNAMVTEPEQLAAMILKYC